MRDKEDRYYDKLVFGSDSYTSNTWPFTEGIINYEMILKKAGGNRVSLTAVPRFYSPRVSCRTWSHWRFTVTCQCILLHFQSMNWILSFPERPSCSR